MCWYSLLFSSYNFPPLFWFPFVFSFCLLYSRLPFSSFTFFVSLLLLFAFVCFLTSGAFTFFSVSFSGVLSYLSSLYVFLLCVSFCLFCLVFVYLLGLGFVVHPVCVCVHLSGFFFFFLIRRVILFLTGGGVPWVRFISDFIGASQPCPRVSRGKTSPHGGCGSRPRIPQIWDEKAWGCIRAATSGHDCVTWSAFGAASSSSSSLF